MRLKHTQKHADNRPRLAVNAVCEVCDTAHYRTKVFKRCCENAKLVVRQQLDPYTTEPQPPIIFVVPPGTPVPTIPYRVLKHFS